MTDRQSLLDEAGRLDKKLLDCLNLLDPETYGIDEATRNYLRSCRRKALKRLSRRKGDGVKKSKRELSKEANCVLPRTISEVWDVLSKVDEDTMLEAALQSVSVPEDFLEKEPSTSVEQKTMSLKLEYKKKSKGKGGGSNEKRKKKLLRKQEKKLKDTLISVKAPRIASKKAKKADKKGEEQRKAPPDDVQYGALEVLGQERKRRKMSALAAAKMTGSDYAALLKKAKKREEKLEMVREKDPVKAEELQAKLHWDAAEKRAQGLKIKDDPKMLEKCLKKKQQRKKSSQKKWDNRVAAVQQAKQRRQETRRKNIQKRVKQKKMKSRR